MPETGQSLARHRQRQDMIQQYAPVDALMRADLEHYCERLVRIVDKAGALRPFVWNKAQHKLHRQLEAQLDAKGWVRALILKARQLGISTYTAARFYQRTTLWPGRRAYILTQEDRATQQLFGMAKRIHDNMPSDYRHPLAVSNANEMSFHAMDSGYRVGTAQNTAGAGRSLTLQLFHGSEVAYWRQADTHVAGVLQAVPRAPDTEVILESTANGIGGAFHDQWTLAVRGESDFIGIFLPWWWEDEYRDPFRASELEFSAEEADYQRLYDLDDAQMAWLHAKNIELGGQPGEICPYFRQEYPATAAEAFQMSGVDSFIPPALVVQARAWTAPDQSHMPLLCGLDIARGGRARTRFMDRQGRKLGGMINRTMHTDNLVVIADQAALYLRNFPIRKMFIDVTGIGSGVYDILRGTWGDRVVAVNFGANATELDRFANKRAEIHARIKEWLMDPGGADLPDDDQIHAEACATGYRHDGNGRLIMEPKEKVETRVGFSPDAWDAACLTFSEAVPVEILKEHDDKLAAADAIAERHRPRTHGSTTWMGA